jgi:hypothetical protein
VGVHKRRLADTLADCRGTACRAPTPCLPTGPCARAAWLFAAGDGPPARGGATTQPGAGLGPRPYLDQHHSPFAIRHSLFAVFFAARRSPSFPIHHSPFAIRYSRFFTARRSPLAARRLSPFAIRCSPRAVGVHKRRLADRLADCRGTACRAPTPCLPTGPCARAAWLFVAGDGPPARCRRHNTTGAGLGPAPTSPGPFTIRRRCGAAGRAQQRCAPTTSPTCRKGGSRTRPYQGQYRSPFAIRHSLFAVFFHSPFAVFRRSPLAARGLSPSATRHSPLATRRLSPFAIRCLSPLAVFLRSPRGRAGAQG